MLLGIYFLFCVFKFARHLNINSDDIEQAASAGDNLFHTTNFLPTKLSIYVTHLIQRRRLNELLFQIVIIFLLYIGIVFFCSWMISLAFNRPHRFGWGLLVYILGELVVFIILSSIFFWNSIKRTNDEIYVIQKKAKEKEDPNGPKSSELETFINTSQAQEDEKNNASFIH